MKNSNMFSFWAGLFLGALVVGVVWYLFSVSDELAKVVKHQSKSEKQKKVDQEISFEFYKMLPELEVVVPEDVEPQPIREALLEGDENQNNKKETTTLKKIESLPGSYYLQTGSFAAADEAEKMKARLSLLGFTVIVQSVNVNGKKYQRVRIGPFAQLPVLKNARQILNANNISYISLKAK